MTRPKALIIDDEKAIRRFVRSVLVAEDFAVEEAETIAAARRAADAFHPDLVVLDLDLPDGDGSALIAPLLADGGPAILVLSAYDEEARKVAALDAGAHDFVTKPFGVPEFMARVRAAMRHRLHEQGAPANFDDGRVRIDLPKHLVQVGGQDARLTPREFEILRLLLTRRRTRAHPSPIDREALGKNPGRGRADTTCPCPQSSPQNRGGVRRRGFGENRTGRGLSLGRPLARAEAAASSVAYRDPTRVNFQQIFCARYTVVRA